MGKTTGFLLGKGKISTFWLLEATNPPIRKKPIPMISQLKPLFRLPKNISGASGIGTGGCGTGAANTPEVRTEKQATALSSVRKQ